MNAKRIPAAKVAGPAGEVVGHQLLKPVLVLAAAMLVATTNGLPFFACLTDAAGL